MSDDNAGAKENRQSPTFWVALGAVTLLAVGTVVRFVVVGGDNAGAALVGLLLSVVLVGVIVAWFARAISSRMRAGRNAFPTALLIPVVVGVPTSEASATLATASGDPGFQLKPSSYATVAVDGDGLHFIRNPDPPWASVSASLVMDARIGATMVGMRSMQGIILRIGAENGSIDLPLVPMRLRGNPLRLMRPTDLRDVAARIQRALTGEADPGWDY